MYQTTTHNIEVTVETHYVEEHSKPENNRYLWAYEVIIKSNRTDTVQLLRRRWYITDSNGQANIVEGEGVVGEQPVLPPGKSFFYTSGCPLSTPSGFMWGQYFFQNENGEEFAVAIPGFSLDMPNNKHTVH
jgi:ApaG protein